MMPEFWKGRTTLQDTAVAVGAVAVASCEVVITMVSQYCCTGNEYVWVGHHWAPNNYYSPWSPTDYYNTWSPTNYYYNRGGVSDRGKKLLKKDFHGKIVSGMCESCPRGESKNGSFNRSLQRLLHLCLWRVRRQGCDPRIQWALHHFHWNPRQIARAGKDRSAKRGYHFPNFCPLLFVIFSLEDPETAGGKYLWVWSETVQAGQDLLQILHRRRFNWGEIILGIAKSLRRGCISVVILLKSLFSYKNVPENEKAPIFIF